MDASSDVTWKDKVSNTSKWSELSWEVSNRREKRKPATDVLSTVKYYVHTVAGKLGLLTLQTGAKLAYKNWAMPHKTQSNNKQSTGRDAQLAGMQRGSRNVWGRNCPEWNVTPGVNCPQTVLLGKSPGGGYPGVSGRELSGGCLGKCPDSYSQLQVMLWFAAFWLTHRQTHSFTLSSASWATTSWSKKCQALTPWFMMMMMYGPDRRYARSPYWTARLRPCIVNFSNLSQCTRLMYSPNVIKKAMTIIILISIPSQGCKFKGDKSHRLQRTPSNPLVVLPAHEINL